MRLAVHVYCATSLDGYIAREDGDIDWLPTPESGDTEDFGYSDFISTIDGKTIQQFMKNGLVDSLTITRIPVLLGSGISLFGYLEADIKLRLMKSQSFSNGLVQDSYSVVRDA
jgi:dihydrofolate reductase